ncbi:MAG: Unknown protein [uncultured Sulfurovum sp.]|uniref:Uncharacterized protein n=1 Tax=uncultured Sulfurovum sp. TaxID=269237 RepID=A0A6S6U2M8_9BACT|nr:MAG: Unknown protein [uncultured Sulfurovum sp.]
MQPTNKEMQLQKNCQLYAYLLESQGKEVPEHIEECVESYEYVMHCAEALFEELKSLDEQTFEKIVNNPDILKSRELSYWWEMKQEANRLGESLTKTCL